MLDTLFRSDSTQLTNDDCDYLSIYSSWPESVDDGGDGGSVWRPEVNSKRHSSGTILGSLTGTQGLSLQASCLCLPHLHSSLCLFFSSCEYWGWDSDPHACEAGPSLMDHDPSSHDPTHVADRHSPALSLARCL